MKFNHVDNNLMDRHYKYNANPDPIQLGCFFRVNIGQCPSGRSRCTQKVNIKYGKVNITYYECRNKSTSIVPRKK